MPRRNTHGGGCCGINHYRGFTGSIEDLLPQLAREVSSSRQFRTSLEVVLTQTQVRIFGRHLEGHGFRPVFKFNNGNSGNDCTVYYYHPNPIPVSPCSDPILPEPVGAALVGRQVTISGTHCRNKGFIVTVIRVTPDGRYLLSTGQVLRRSSFILQDT